MLALVNSVEMIRSLRWRQNPNKIHCWDKRRSPKELSPCRKEAPPSSHLSGRLCRHLSRYLTVWFGREWLSTALIGFVKRCGWCLWLVLGAVWMESEMKSGVTTEETFRKRSGSIASQQHATTQLSPTPVGPTVRSYTIENILGHPLSTKEDARSSPTQDEFETTSGNCW